MLLYFLAAANAMYCSLEFCMFKIYFFVKDGNAEVMLDYIKLD